MEKILLIQIITLLAIIFWLGKKFVDRRRKVGKLQFFGRQTTPIFVTANVPNDPTVGERADEIRELLKESGNKWNIPVIELPHNDAGNFGENFYNEYLVRIGKYVCKETNKFMLEVKRDDAIAYKEGVLGQQNVRPIQMAEN